MEEAARRGSASALAALEPRPVPDDLAYLRAWLYELHATRRYDMNGAGALEYPMIDSWARLTHRNPSPRDVDALFILDHVLRFPDEAEDQNDRAVAGSTAPSVDTPAWPTKKPSSLPMEPE